MSLPVQAKIAFLVGPTGVGKTELAIYLARELCAEIVNCDSRQVYVGMDIGTAKPTPTQRALVPHHMLDVRTPDEPLDAVSFAELADGAIADIHRRGRRVLVVGGSGLYVRALRWGIFPGPGADPNLRAELTARAQRYGSAALHEELRAIDPDTASRLAPNDLKRIIRALEVFYLTGVPISVHHARHKPSAPRYQSLAIGLMVERELLYRSLDERFEHMLAAGFIEEVRTLLNKGYDTGTPALDTIGYKQIAAYLRGEMPLADAIEQAKRETRRFAKRQLTWFKREPEIRWFDPRHCVKQLLDVLLAFFDGVHKGAIFDETGHA